MRCAVLSCTAEAAAGDARTGAAAAASDEPHDDRQVTAVHTSDARGHVARAAAATAAGHDAPAAATIRTRRSALVNS